MGKAEYPEGVLETLKEKVDTTVLNASEIAEGLGNVKAMNIVLFGAMVKAMNLTEIPWEKIIAANVKPKFIDMNINAFNVGVTVNTK